MAVGQRRELGGAEPEGGKGALGRGKRAERWRIESDSRCVRELELKLNQKIESKQLNTQMQPFP